MDANRLTELARSLERTGVLLCSYGNAAGDGSLVSVDEYSKACARHGHALSFACVSAALADVVGVFERTRSYDEGMNSFAARSLFMTERAVLWQRKHVDADDCYISHGDFVAAMLVSGFRARFNAQSIGCTLAVRL